MIDSSTYVDLLQQLSQNLQVHYCSTTVRTTVILAGNTSVKIKDLGTLLMTIVTIGMCTITATVKHSLVAPNPFHRVTQTSHPANLW